jgi:folate-binding protein YgfZ
LRAGAGGAGVIDLSDGERLLFTGPQALWFLDQLVTNQVKDLPMGAGCEALLLTPKGRIVAAMRVFHASKGIHAHIEPGAEKLGDFFRQRVFATRVRVEDVTAELGMLRILGSGASGMVAAALGLEVLPEAEHSLVEVGSRLIVALSAPLDGFDLFIERDRVAATVEVISRLGAIALSPAAYDRHRVAAGVARFGVDFGESHLPQEAALERAVHFRKGCYLGQESVAMAQRGRVKRRIRHLQFEGPATVGRIAFEGSDSGIVTSSAMINGTGFGIATVSTATPLAARVSVLGPDGAASTAVVNELPGTRSGPAVPSARELRERLQRNLSSP